MLWDTHMHCNFSGDSDALPEDMVASAKRKGLDGICFTDHLDLDYKEEPGLFDLDLPAYYRKISELQKTSDFPIRFGIEMGLQPHLAETHNKLIAEYPFDFVIGSSHVVNGIDPYYPSYYEGKTERQAYMEYFESILTNLAYDVDFDVYGHIDYVVRYGPNRNANYSYEAYQDVIDEILRTLLRKDKGLELNTAGFKYGLGHPNPTEAILKRYRDLGGEIITIGADAHKPEHVAYDFEKVPGILQEAGFRYYTVFRKRKAQFLPL